MAKKILILNVIFILFCTSAFGQKDSVNKKAFFAIKTDLAFLSGYAFPVIYKRGYIGALSVEKGFSFRHSFQLTSDFFKYTNSLSAVSLRLIPE